MRTSAPFGAKDFRFFEIYGVSAGTRRIETVRTRRVNFSRFLCGYLYDGPLYFNLSIRLEGNHFNLC